MRTQANTKPKSLRDAFSTLRIPPHVKVRWTQNDAEIAEMARSVGIFGVPSNARIRDTAMIFGAEVGTKFVCFIQSVGYQEPQDNGWSALIFDRAADLDSVYQHLTNGLLGGHLTSTQ